MIELTHLRIVAALSRQGTLTAAADALCVTQSALSHQIRCLEQRLDIKVWRKDGRRVRLTQAGLALLETAEAVIPRVDQTEIRMRAIAEGREGQLRIGVECYPCYEWLNGIIADYLGAEPGVDVDIMRQFQFSGLEGLLQRRIDLLVTPDRIDHPDVGFETLFEYELVLLVAESHSLAGQVCVMPQDLREDLLISFPVAPERLDILHRFLWPAKVQPRALKRVESIEVMLQLVANRRGICTLPLWLARQACQRLPIRWLHLGESGIHARLLGAFRGEDAELAYLQRFLSMSRGFAGAGMIDQT